MVDIDVAAQHDVRAEQAVRTVHDALNPVQTILFGSRARWDYRRYSDTDIFIITGNETAPDYRKHAKSVAEKARKDLLPEAGKTDVISWTSEKSLSSRNLNNNLANYAAREGLPIMPPEQTGYSSDYGEEAIDCNNVKTRVKDALGNADALQNALNINRANEKALDYIAQKALEHGYKALPGADGHRNTVGWRGTISMAWSRWYGNGWPCHLTFPSPARNEHSYLSEFAGGTVDAVGGGNLRVRPISRP